MLKPDAKSQFLIVAILFNAFFSCQNTSPQQTPFNYNLPNHFPAVAIPDDNDMTVEKIELGEKLFFDSTLSSDSTISCASCHLPKFAFSDTLSLSKGVNNALGKRNAPTLTNVAYNAFYFLDGGANTLELQLHVPFTEHQEMNMTYPELINRLNKNKYYMKSFNAIFGKDPDLFGLTRAISAFERTLISTDSRYDQFIAGDSTILSKPEIAGMNLFNSDETHCSNCHNGFNFTNNSFENIGLFELDEDYGRMRITTRTSDHGKFKVPTLRNVEVTAPYMHDGSMNTLMEVIDHFNSGGKNNPRKNALVKPLGLNNSEKENLVAFLKTLTDNSFLEFQNK